MKKLFVLLLTLVCSLGLVACNGKTEEITNEDYSKEVTQLFANTAKNEDGTAKEPAEVFTGLLVEASAELNIPELMTIEDCNLKFQFGNNILNGFEDTDLTNAAIEAKVTCKNLQEDEETKLNAAIYLQNGWLYTNATENGEGPKEKLYLGEQLRASIEGVTNPDPEAPEVSPEESLEQMLASLDLTMEDIANYQIEFEEALAEIMEKDGVKFEKSTKGKKTTYRVVVDVKVALPILANFIVDVYSEVGELDAQSKLMITTMLKQIVFEGEVKFEIKATDGVLSGIGFGIDAKATFEEKDYTFGFDFNAELTEIAVKYPTFNDYTDVTPAE
jgi:rubrerythrin